jgi:hypothetical protein
MTDDNAFTVGFIGPLRPTPLGEREYRRRQTIGFVHFGEPEPEPGQYVEEYVKLIMDGEMILP